MTTEPRPLHTEGPKLKRFDVTRSQVVSLAETNAKLTADNARLRDLLQRWLAIGKRQPSDQLIADTERGLGQ